MPGGRDLWVPCLRLLTTPRPSPTSSASTPHFGYVTWLAGPERPVCFSPFSVPLPFSGHGALFGLNSYRFCFAHYFRPRSNTLGHNPSPQLVYTCYHSPCSYLGSVTGLCLIICGFQLPNTVYIAHSRYLFNSLFSMSDFLVKAREENSGR